MATIRVTAVQMKVSTSLEDNLRTILHHIEKHETDFLVFPEASVTGRHGGFSQKAVERAWDQIAEACRQRYTTAIVGTGCQENGTTFNQVRVISDAGETLGAQDQLVPTKADRGWCHAGQELQVFEHGEIRFGCLVGNDMWVAPGLGAYPDPKLTYRLSEQGARWIFHCADSGADPAYAPYYESNIVLRAKEIGGYIICANAASDGNKLNAQTGVAGPDGTWLAVCPRQGEHVCQVDLDAE